MPSPQILFFFDYVDPLSFLLDRELDALVCAEPLELSVRRVPLEVRPPPEPMMAHTDPWWLARWEEALRRSGTPRPVRPDLLPWTRKAHELVLHAHAHGQGREMHREVFAAIFERGSDIGRVDVLVELARQRGLDAQETKAVLDVDKYGREAAAGRERALLLGVEDVPCLAAGGELLRGFHNRDVLHTFLCSS